MLTKEILCAYLPHDVEVLRFDWFGNLLKGKTNLNSMDLGHLEAIQLKLNPLYLLNKPITHKGETFIPMKRLWKMSGAFEKDENFKGEPFRIHIHEGVVMCFSAVCLHVNQWELFQKLLEWHFDIFGLIDAGYAVSLEEEENGKS